MRPTFRFRAHAGTLSLAAALLLGWGAGTAAQAPHSSAASRRPLAPASGAGTPVSGTFTVRTPASTASYTAHETFLQHDLPGTPVGTTHGVRGSLVLAAGRFRPSAVAVDLRGLSTGVSLRDARVQKVLATAKYPDATFAITGERAGSPLVTAGHTVHVQLSGRLTIDRVTRAVTWSATATASGGTLRLTATTDVNMTAFGVHPPDLAGFVAVRPGIQLGARLLAAAAGAPVSGTFAVRTPGSTASYTAHETFLQHNLPGTPVGTTHGVRGTLVLAAGRFRPSAVTVDLRGLSTGVSLRDARVQQVLATAKYPDATFAITGEKAGAPLVTSGHTVHMRLTGKLTIDRVTKPVTWSATATASGGTLRLTATADVNMTAFGVHPPDLAGFVAVQPGIQLGAHLTATAG